MASMWRRAMVYLGLVDDEEYDDYEPYEEPPAPVVRRTAVPAGETELGDGGVRTLVRESEPGPIGGPNSSGAVSIRSPAPVVVRPATSAAKVHVVAPGGFNDAQEIGDKLKASQPVIVNLQGVNRDLSRRLIDFASGLTYGIGGQMERVADQVFLLTPSNVEVSAEEKRRLQERGLFQS